MLFAALASACAAGTSATSAPTSTGSPTEPAPVAGPPAAPPPAAPPSSVKTKAPDDALTANVAAYVAGLPPDARKTARITVFEELPAALVSWQSDFDIVFALISRAGAVVESRDVQCGAPRQTADGSPLLDLRGDGRKSVVFTQVNGGASCTNGTDIVYEFVADTWVTQAVLPERPSELVEAPAGAKPSFPVELFSFAMGEASWATNGLWTVSVVGWESWDGATYSRQAAPHLELYREAYERRMTEARAVLGSASCTSDELDIAAEIYVFGTLLGISEKELLRTADHLMVGRSTKPCMEAQATSWPSWARIRASLRSARGEIAKLR